MMYGGIQWDRAGYGALVADLGIVQLIMTVWLGGRKISIIGDGVELASILLKEKARADPVTDASPYP